MLTYRSLILQRCFFIHFIEDFGGSIFFVCLLLLSDTHVYKDDREYRSFKIF